ncbi:MAG: hypothetical protein KF912_05925 [Phycisphaeraceae bacterium]|nr:hypothetical protein [Phycisphaeraceae bacterium]
MSRATPPPSRTPAILFTAFEPSGDDHASAVIARLRRTRPDISIHAWGGPKMAEAGATIVERTGDDAVMGMPGIKKIKEHRGINRRIAAWLESNPVAVHVPVDSPAANFPICRIAKRRGIRVVHLVAPQVWAWGSWRINKLRKLTDHVLCLLPFEEPWFNERSVRATFIGHPLFDHVLDPDSLDTEAAALGQTHPRIAIMPGSRPGEIQRNFPILHEAFRRLKADHPQLIGCVAATTPRVEQTLRSMAADLGGWPAGLEMLSGRTDAIVRWCDLALVVSGTVTLQIAKQCRPMVIVYKSGLFDRALYTIARDVLFTTDHFTLPNLIAGREIVPELVPHFGDAEPIVRHASDLLESPDLASLQRSELQRVVEQFASRDASSKAAELIADAADEACAAMSAIAALNR